MIGLIFNHIVPAVLVVAGTMWLAAEVWALYREEPW